jgi:hypothetical protein
LPKGETNSISNEDEILKEIREFRDYAWKRSEKNRREADLDMIALSVDGPWPKEELEARGKYSKVENPRPCGHTDIISPYNNRVVNQARMNPRGVDVIPNGEGADKKTAERREDRIRGISYESHASQARLTALQNSVDRGIGYWRVDTEYASPRSRNLKIVVKRIPNPNSILDDPDCQEADRSDRKQLLATQWITKSEAKRRWKNMKDPDVEIQGFSAAESVSVTAWLRPDSIMFAEYWKVEEQKERVLFFGGNSEGCFESELESKGLKLDGDTITDSQGQQFPLEDEREGTSKKVCQYFTNGFQIFEKKPWPGSTIPFPTCVGREKYEGDELVIESLTRKLREPNLNFDVSVAGELEQFGMSTKSKIMVSDKAIEGYETQWKLAHRNPQAYLKYHERDEQGNQVQQPKEILFQAQIEGYEVARNSFIRDAQNAAGMTGVDQKQRQSESGVAQDKIDAAADTNNFHFIDSYLSAIEFEGRIENELLAYIEDSERTVGFQTKDGKYKSEKITPYPDQPHPYGPPEGHSVTISTGPDSVSQMVDAQKFAELLTKNPELLTNPLSPLIIQLKNLGPVGDKMIKVATALQPPPVQAAYADPEGQQEPTPPHAVAAIEQLKGMAQALNAHGEELQQKVIELEDEKQGKVVDNQGKMALLEREYQLKKMLQDDQQAFEMAMIGKQMELKKLEIQEKLLMQSRDLSHKGEQASADRQHASQESAADREAAAASQNGTGE